VQEWDNLKREAKSLEGFLEQKIRAYGANSSTGRASAPIDEGKRRDVAGVP
jgi:hypothetical protein